MKRAVANMKRTIILIIGLLAVFGLVDSIYLTYTHYQSSVPASWGAGASCSIVGKNACNIVDTSFRDTFFGIPTALLGALYFAALCTAVAARIVLHRWIAPVAFGLMLFMGFGFSVYLIYVMFFVIHAVCAYCMAAHMANIVGIGLIAASTRL